MNKYIKGFTLTIAIAMLFVGFTASAQTNASASIAQIAVPVCTVNTFTINGSSTFASVAYNSQAQLAWSTTGCAGVTVLNASYSTTGSASTPALTSTQNFTLIAYPIGSIGSIVNRTVTANVAAQTPTCAINTFTINGSSTFASVAYNSQAQLAWSTSNCTQVTVLGVPQNAIGSASTPALTSTQNFTLVGMNSNGSTINRTVTANVAAQTPTCAINTFTINGSSTSASVSYNGQAKLAWTTSNCVRVNVLGVDYYGSQANSGTVGTSPLTYTQNFVLTAYDATVAAINRTVTANVAAQTSSCVINSFAINGSQTFANISYNGMAQLTWNTSNCTSIMVNGVRYTGSQANAGGVAVGPLTYTQNFTLTANDVTGVQVQRTVTANVGTVSTICKIYSFMANGSTTATVAYNASATLSWVTTGCSSATVNGVTYTGPNALSDSITTLPLTSPVNTFTLTATDSSGNTDNSTVTVNVGNKQSACSIVSFTANGLTGSVTVSPNSSATLSWTTTNCASVAVNGFTYTDTASVNAGTVTVNVTNGTYNYTLSAIDATGTNISKTVTILTNQNGQGSSCQIVSFQPSQTSVTPGTSVTLNWVLTNCNGYATVSGGNLGNTQVYNSFITTGAIYSNTTFTLVAYGSNGYASTANTYVNINNNNTSTGCYISTFAANGSNFTTINPGSTANITWGVSGCSSVTVSGPGIYSQNTTGSMQTPQIYVSTQYTITAYDLFYNTPQTKTIYVYTSQNGGNTNQTMYAPITTIATRIATTSARLNGLVPANGSVGSVSAYFEYGTSSALGSTTNPQIVSTNTLVNYFDTISTSPNTTYYFRAVTQNGNTFLRGDIISFVTPATQTTPIVIQNVTYGTGTGSALASVTIADQSQSVKAGDYVSYTVDYKNVSNQTLSNVTLNVILPNGVTFRGSTQGMPTTNNTVVIGLNSLSKGAEGSINIQASVDQSVVPGTNLVATATLTFTNTAGAQDSAIGYVLNSVAGSSISATTTDQNNMGAFALGAGFFPTTFLGWVILLGIIIIIILLIRHFVLVGGANQNKGHYADPHGDVHH